MSSKVKVIAHRGFSGIAPENTLIAFQKALDLGVDFIELDVHQTKDNVIVVIHDEDIRRTCNGAGLVKEMTYKELMQFDAGIWRGPAFKGEKIPTLAQVLELVKGATNLLIEIKDTYNEYEGIEERTLELIERYSAKKWCVLQSFDDFSLERIKLIDGRSTFELHKLLEFEIDPLFDEIGSGVYRYVKAINVDSDLLTEAIVAKIHAHKFKVYTWTVNTEEAIRKVIEMKVDGIISNFPDRVKKVLAAYEK
jgi:glycerophosphoryl diester phosphodiesterase